MPRNPVINRIINWNQFVAQKTCKLDKKQRTLQNVQREVTFASVTITAPLAMKFKGVEVRGSAGYLPFTW